MNERYLLDPADAGVRVTVRCAIPADAKTIILLTHGAGAGIDHWFMTGLEHKLFAAGFGVVTFQFPFMESGKRRTDSQATAVITWQTLIGHARERWPGLRLLAAGKSWGGRMLSHWAVQAHDTFGIKGLIFLGFPLHPSGRPDIARAAHLPLIPFPMLFLQGTRDALASPELMLKVTEPLRNTSLVFVDGADHGFQSGRKNFIPQLADAVSGWNQHA